MQQPRRNIFGASLKVSAVTALLGILVWLAGIATTFSGDCQPEGRPAEDDTSISFWPPGQQCVEKAGVDRSKAGPPEEYVRDPGPALGTASLVMGVLTAALLLGGLIFELIALRRR